MVRFIDVIDKSCEVSDGVNRKVSLSISDKTTPKKMTLLGELNHGAEIEFDKVNAQLLIDYLQKNVIDI